MSTVKTGGSNQKKVVKNDHAKIFLDFPIHTDKHLLHNLPDIVSINYEEQTGLIIDIAVSRDENIQDKELKKKLTNISH